MTGACLLTKKNLYHELSGLNEKYLPVTYNDVDFCLRALNRGYLIVYTLYAELYRHESVTRGNDSHAKNRDPADYQRALEEADYMREMWADALRDDIYYNINLTRTGEQFDLRLRGSVLRGCYDTFSSSILTLWK